MSDYRYYPQRSEGMPPANCLYPRNSAKAARARRILVRGIESEIDMTSVYELLANGEEMQKRPERVVADFDAEIRRFDSIKGRLTDEQTESLSELRHKRMEAIRNVEDAKDRVERIKEVIKEEEDWYESTKVDESTRIKTPVVTVTRNERTYRPDTDPNGDQFILDVTRSFMLNDPKAWTRLNRHMDEETADRNLTQRAAGDFISTNGAGLIVPQYLVDMAAPDVAARRPFLDNGVTCHNLPAEGMSIEISKGGHTAAEAQSAELAEMVSPVTYDDTKISVPVKTVFAVQNVSRQAIERGSAVEPLLMNDLMVRVNSLEEYMVIQDAVTGLDAVGTAVTYTSAAPTVAELYPIILEAQAGIEEALLGQPVDTVVMASRRWSWLSGAMTSTWPLINSAGIPAQSGGLNNGAAYGGIRGRLPNGLNVIVSANVPLTKGVGTNEDRIYVLSSRECHLWEEPGGPVYIRAEQPLAPGLGVQLVVYRYFGYLHTRFDGAQAVIGGTGLIDPYA